MNAVEAFFSQYENTASALGAISTFAAVVVSLWLASRTEKTRIRASVSGTFLVHNSIDSKNRPSFLSANVTNEGILPLRIPFSFFCWQVPFCRERWMISPLDSFKGANPFIAQKTYPIKIDPKHSESFFLSDKATFHSEMEKSFALLRFPVIRAYLIKAEVHADDGTKCRVNIAKGIKKEIIQCAQAAKTKAAR